MPGGPVCLLQNWFTKAECTSALSEANSCLLPPWKSAAEVSQLKLNLYCGASYALDHGLEATCKVLVPSGRLGKLALCCYQQ